MPGAEDDGVRRRADRQHEPQLAEIVAGIISSRGSTPKPIDAAARIGSTAFTVATFVVNSVMKTRIKQTAVTNSHAG